MSAETPAPTGLRERKKQQTRTALHRAALELLIADGEQGLTVERIAARVGVAPRTFFNYFATKEDALRGQNPDLVESFVAMVAASDPADGAARIVARILLRYVQTIPLDPELWELRRRAACAHPHVATLMLGGSRRLDKALADAAVRHTTEVMHGDPLAAHVAALATIGAFRAATRHFADSGYDGSLEDVVRSAFAYLPAAWRVTDLEGPNDEAAPA